MYIVTWIQDCSYQSELSSNIEVPSAFVLFTHAHNCYRCNVSMPVGK